LAGYVGIPETGRLERDSFDPVSMNAVYQLQRRYTSTNLRVADAGAIQTAHLKALRCKGFEQMAGV